MFQIKYGCWDFIGIYHTDAVYARGIAVDITAATANLIEQPGSGATGIVASKILSAATGEYLGFIYQDVTATGVGYLQQDQKVPSTDVLLGNEVTIAEGKGKIVTDIVTEYGESGAVTDTLAHDSFLSIANGRWKVAAAGETVKGRYIGLWNGNSGQYYIEVL